MHAVLSDCKKDGRMMVNRRLDPKRVLVVDDDRDMVKGLELYLTLEGWQVSCAFNGDDAIRELADNDHAAIILDVLMPQLGGDQVCMHVRDQMGDSETPLIVLSAVNDPKSRKRMLDLGANAYLTKPCDFERVCETVSRYVA